MIVQGGAYGEHVCERVSIEGHAVEVQNRAIPRAARAGCRRAADDRDEAICGQADASAPVASGIGRHPAWSLRNQMFASRRSIMHD